jgi:hypothetical protein
LPAAAPTPWTYPRTFGPGDVHGVLRDFKFAAIAEGAFFSSRGLRQMFAKYYFNNPTVLVREERTGRTLREERTR